MKRINAYGRSWLFVQCKLYREANGSIRVPKTYITEKVEQLREMGIV